MLVTAGGRWLNPLNKADAPASASLELELFGPVNLYIKSSAKYPRTKYIMVVPDAPWQYDYQIGPSVHPPYYLELNFSQSTNKYYHYTLAQEAKFKSNYLLPIPIRDQRKSYRLKFRRKGSYNLSYHSDWSVVQAGHSLVQVYPKVVTLGGSTFSATAA